MMFIDIRQRRQRMLNIILLRKCIFTSNQEIRSYMYVLRKISLLLLTFAVLVLL